MFMYNVLKKVNCVNKDWYLIFEETLIEFHFSINSIIINYLKNTFCIRDWILAYFVFHIVMKYRVHIWISSQIRNPRAPDQVVAASEAHPPVQNWIFCAILCEALHCISDIFSYFI